MLRNRIDQPYGWILAWALLALLLLLAESILFPKSAIALAASIKEMASALML
jgi:hypothetical protein